MVSGVSRDWRYAPYPNLHFPSYARAFEAAAPGTLEVIPIVPAGWSMRLTKRAPLCDSMPIGRIDQPSAGASVVGATTPAAGWVTAAQPVQKISINVDHAPAQSAQPDIARPDVDPLFPHSPIKNKGWATTLDMSKVAPGIHEIEARAVEANGCDAEFAAVNIKRMK